MRRGRDERRRSCLQAACTVLDLRRRRRWRGRLRLIAVEGVGRVSPCGPLARSGVAVWRPAQTSHLGRKKARTFVRRRLGCAVPVEGTAKALHHDQIAFGLRHQTTDRGRALPVAFVQRPADATVRRTGLRRTSKDRRGGDRAWSHDSTCPERYRHIGRPSLTSGAGTSSEPMPDGTLTTVCQMTIGAGATGSCLTRPRSV
jgi:hypothetical protein